MTLVYCIVNVIQKKIRRRKANADNSVPLAPLDNVVVDQVGPQEDAARSHNAGRFPPRTASAPSLVDVPLVIPAPQEPEK